MKFHFKTHKEKNGFWAECIELKGCKTQADSWKELNKNMQDALNLFLNEPVNSKIIFPLPRKKMTEKNITSVLVHPRIAFSFYLRQFRLKNGMTQKQISEKLGMKNIFNYQRLENPKMANPELETISRLKRIFPKFSMDELLAA